MKKVLKPWGPIIFMKYSFEKSYYLKKKFQNTKIIQNYSSRLDFKTVEFSYLEQE